MSKQVIFIVANSEFLAKRLISLFPKNHAVEIYSTPSPTEPTGTEGLITYWKEIEGYRVIDSDKLHEGKLNVIICPFRAIMKSYDIYHEHGLGADVLIVALKEKDSTEAITYEIYDIYADSSMIIEQSLLDYYFSRPKHKFEDVNFKTVKRK
nr:MAG TPA: hypothetical protein [Caudoviricetes sp.]